MADEQRIKEILVKDAVKTWQKEHGKKFSPEANGMIIFFLSREMSKMLGKLSEVKLK